MMSIHNTSIDFITYPTVEKSGLLFKISENTRYGYIMVVTTSYIFKYSRIKYFPDFESAKEWITRLENSARLVCRSILES